MCFFQDNSSEGDRARTRVGEQMRIPVHTSIRRGMGVRGAQPSTSGVGRGREPQVRQWGEGIQNEEPRPGNRHR